MKFPGALIIARSYAAGIPAFRASGLQGLQAFTRGHAVAVGPAEYLVIAFPGGRFTDAIAPALAEAVASDAVRILDLTFVRRGENGTLEHRELQDLDPEELVLLEPVAAQVAGLLNEEDIEELGQRVPPGSSAVLIVWEDLWAVPLTRAVHAAGGELVAHERVPAGLAEAAVERAARNGGGALQRLQRERIAPAPEGGDDVIDRLERLAELKQQGVLTDAEFAAQKTRILAD
jgi:hypothetical protein